MKRFVFLVTLALGLAGAAANAATFPIPDENPIATVSIPDSWGPKTYDGGVEATSDDGGIYVAMEAVAAEDVKSALEEGLKFFVKSGVEINSEVGEDPRRQDQQA